MNSSTTQADRLRELLEFAQQSALLRASPIPDITRYGIFHEFEHAISCLPGLAFNRGSADGEEEIWLVIERLQEAPVPQPESILLKTWIESTNNPAKEPTLRSHVEIQALIEIGAFSTPKDTSNFDPRQLMALSSFDQKKAVEEQFKAYIENVWKLWAAEEKRRRRTISLYAKLFTLKQQLEGGIVDAQIELVWGSGVAVWNMAGTQVVYPLVTRLVELSLDESTMEIEVRPRDIDPRVELDIYSVKDNPGVPDTEKAAKEFFSKATTTFSPFDRSSFESLLHSAVTYLDPKGIYWPSLTSAEDRSLPKASEELKVTDTWVLFARPRSASLFIQDIERFKKKLDDQTITIPPPLTAIVTDPSTTNEDVPLPLFRGLSTSCGSSGQSGGSQPCQDLFFPMPFNNEQVRIVQLLECSDGVVVQGPPGTGKTHTIGNIICHYLALGKRVLVTSMKDPALAVLQDKLPAEIRPLAISLLTSEQEGMRQFEYAVSKIAAEVQRLDRFSLSREITQIENSIDVYHAKLAKLDNQISEWAIKNLTPIELNGEIIEPINAAEIVVKNEQMISWFEDPISIGTDCSPHFNDSDIVRLREARRTLLSDLDYLGSMLPLISAFPDARDLTRAHQDLARAVELQSQVDSGEVPRLIDSSKATFEVAQRLSAQIANLKLLRQAINDACCNWSRHLLSRLHKRYGDAACAPQLVVCPSCSTKNRIKHQISPGQHRCGNCSAEIPVPSTTNYSDELLVLFESLGSEIEASIAERKQFLAKPIAGAEDIELAHDLVNGIENLAQGRQAFEFSELLSDDLTTLAAMLKSAVEEHAQLSCNAVAAPNELEHNASVLEGIEKLSNGRRPFGLTGLFTKSEEKALITEIRINGSKPKTATEWRYVLDNLNARKRFAELAMRWNSQVEQIELRDFYVVPSQDGALQSAYKNCQKLLELITSDKKREVRLREISVLNAMPSNASDWQHVLNYVRQLKCCRDLLTRWNALTEDLQIPTFPTSPSQITAANDAFNIYRKP